MPATELKLACLDILLAIINEKSGIDKFISDEGAELFCELWLAWLRAVVDCMFQTILCLETDSEALKWKILKLFAICCLFSPEGYDKTVKSFTYYAIQMKGCRLLLDFTVDD